jgi:hypothetical protein
MTPSTAVASDKADAEDDQHDQENIAEVAPDLVVQPKQLAAARHLIKKDIAMPVHRDGGEAQYVDEGDDQIERYDGTGIGFDIAAGDILGDEIRPEADQGNDRIPGPADAESVDDIVADTQNGVADAAGRWKLTSHCLSPPSSAIRKPEASVKSAP